ncbi:MAG: pyridoxal phosphate-dependent aminotransferase [bacterium]
MRERIPAHISALKPFLAMEIMERAQQLEARGQRIIHLEIGEPDFDTPACIKEACIRALRDSRPRYTHSLGLLELREEICREYERNYGVSISPDRILVTCGTSPAMLLTFSVLAHRDDAFLVSNPHYPCYPNFIRFTGARVKWIPVREEDGFQYTTRDVQAAVAGRVRAIVVNSPSNPSGTVIPPEVLQAVGSMDVTVISDEIYHGLVYEGEAHSVLQYQDRAFVLNGFSKLYAMTGWRLGYVIAPSAYMRALQTLHQNFFISASSFVQDAALAALRLARTEVENMRRVYDGRRRLIVQGLRKLGFGISAEPTGAFYVLANARKYGADSKKLALELLEHAGVGTTPGIDFGSNAEGYLRFTYANSQENIEEALERIRKFVEARDP